VNFLVFAYTVDIGFYVVNKFYTSFVLNNYYSPGK